MPENAAKPENFRNFAGMKAIRIIPEKCVRCGVCARECPQNVLVQHAERAVPAVEQPEACIACGHCVDLCPSGALQHPMFPPETLCDVDAGRLPSPESVLELMRSRRSNRSITPRPVPENVISDMLEAARYAPTAENSRRVHVAVLRDAADIRGIEDATMRFFLRIARVLLHPIVRPLTRLFLADLYRQAPALEVFRQRWQAGELPSVCNAKVILAFSAPKGYDFGWQDCNLAYQNASLVAEAHGIAQVYLGFVQTACKLFGPRRTARLLHLPEGHRLYAIMAVGVPAVKYRRYAQR